ncbi:lycopene cyclase domain-containing protein [Gracilimonas sp.]|uniref:lycopene cyclase domain-containing protein n=1 Tax=Gracilimonas sp. TaxID=1974203 RepID=UPI0032EB22CA
MRQFQWVLFLYFGIIKSYKSVWTFNNSYYLGIDLFGLPLEEIFFFITVPIACLFIKECLQYFQKIPSIKNDGILILIGIAYCTQLYTSTVCLLSASAIGWHYVFGKIDTRSKTYITFGVSLIPFLIINGILTGLFTEEPLVQYNSGEFSGISICTIPIEDAIYLFPLLLLNISVYEIFIYESSAS